MKAYRYLLWDVDGTILNFLAAEKAAIRKLFIKYGFGECSDEMISRYSTINRKYWEALERNEITKQQVLIGRFREFFGQEGMDVSKAENFNSDYQLALGDTIVFCDDSYHILQSLKNNYVLAAVTNGTKQAQDRKLAASHLDAIFDYIFISEEIGIEKPNVEFFEEAARRMSITNRKEVLIIGDSLTSDIRGGNNYGVDTCWYNPQGKEKNINVEVTYEIRDLHELLDILKK